MDLGTSGHEQQPRPLVSSNSDQYQQQQQQQTTQPLSPLRPVAASMLQATSSYYSTPSPLMQQHGAHHELAKMAKLATSGNGLGGGAPPLKSAGNDHKTSDQVVTDQAREILRQAVVTAVTESNKAAAAANTNNNNNVSKKVVPGAVRYRECQKNHAASIGGHAIDGCGEFMPLGDAASDEAGDMRCAACDCHRNFHRREVEGEVQCSDCNTKRHSNKLPNNKPSIVAPTPNTTTLPVTTLALTGGPLTMAVSADSDGDQDDGPGHIVTSGGMMMSSMRSPSAIKKRFRTKFTTEQKDKMLAFAEKVGWRIQKHDEAAVHEFCVSVGVKRHVLKVWMHNNKHTMGKKP